MTFGTANWCAVVAVRNRKTNKSHVTLIQDIVHSYSNMTTGMTEVTFMVTVVKNEPVRPKRWSEVRISTYRVNLLLPVSCLLVAPTGTAEMYRRRR
jgi:hypothetical protein